MGRDLWDASPAARSVFELADATLQFRLSQLCFEGPDDALTATENAQPALLTVSTALLATLAGGLEAIPAYVSERAAFVAGHSLGEYSALVAAGALLFPTALQLVRRRGELMASAHEGGMAAILGLDEQALEAACETARAYGDVVIANYNAPGQLVLSGTSQAVAQACELAKQRGAKRAVPLKVSAAFHSPLMQAAADGLRAALEAADFADARVPVLANVNAEPLQEAGALREELAAQVTAPVRWIASVERMAAAGVDTFVEIGPGAVLSGLIKRIVPGAALRNVARLEDVQGQ